MHQKKEKLQLPFLPSFHGRTKYLPFTLRSTEWSGQKSWEHSLAGARISESDTDQKRQWLQFLMACNEEHLHSKQLLTTYDRPDWTRQREWSAEWDKSGPRVMESVIQLTKLRNIYIFKLHIMITRIIHWVLTVCHTRVCFIQPSS